MRVWSLRCLATRLGFHPASSNYQPLPYLFPPHPCFNSINLVGLGFAEMRPSLIDEHHSRLSTNLPYIIYCTWNSICYRDGPVPCLGDSMLPSPVGRMELSASEQKSMCYSNRIYSDINKLMGFEAKPYLDNRPMYSASYSNHRPFGTVKCERDDLPASYHPYLQLPSATHTATHSWGNSTPHSVRCR